MEDNNGWQSRAEKTLNSLNGIQRAPANPFLYTRVKARLDEQRGFWAKAARFLGQPALAFSASILFIAINVGVALNNHATANDKLTDAGQMMDTEYATLTYSLENTADK